MGWMSRITGNVRESTEVCSVANIAEKKSVFGINHFGRYIRSELRGGFEKNKKHNFLIFCALWYSGVTPTNREKNDPRGRENVFFQDSVCGMGFILDPSVFKSDSLDSPSLIR
ncbi:unnamed protein product [Acanthoscelides obtectus]|uniref:Uncharacterized protein n=1 Tax=Acanthoscelides obtectus TaxID=200917 RepID=A0A9P0Q001_ACAOB|nr:unnamed protein product [Acanthoscelides obtectus]CAK1670744.1 hypothetical protein AOBTE_LOCUS27802 [Acanthoscelides obtectus]